MVGNSKTDRLVKIAVLAAIYVVLTLAIAPLSYGIIQIRIAEVLVLLCFYKKDNCYSMIIGCLVANLFSPMAALDVPFGTLATALSVLCIYKLGQKQGKIKSLLLASIFPVVINGVIIGLELFIAFNEPLLLSIGSVALGELVAVTVIGVPVVKLLQKCKAF